MMIFSVQNKAQNVRFEQSIWERTRCMCRVLVHGSYTGIMQFVQKLFKSFYKLYCLV